jgi:hypothetical protein
LVLLFLFHGASYEFRLTKIAWAAFWAHFTQTHLVTLSEKKRSSRQNCADMLDGGACWLT